MKQKRKRAPGGGRKPAGPFKKNASQLTIRMPSDMRAELEAAAHKRGWNVTQETLWRLRGSLSKDRLDRHDQVTRALCFLIAQAAQPMPVISKDWHRNPFLFRAFKLAVAKLLDALEPPGEMQGPPRLSLSIFQTTESGEPAYTELGAIDIYESPETLASFTTATTLNDLARPAQLYQMQLSRQKAKLRLNPDDFSEHMIAELEHAFYGMSDVRSDLGIKEPEYAGDPEPKPGSRVLDLNRRAGEKT